MPKLAKILDTENLHHSTLFKANFEDVINDLRDEIKKELKISVRGNPDYSESDFETFTIEDARSLSERAQNTPLTEDGKKIFIISLKNITHEAQNALLKLFEEPPKQTHFILISPNTSFFLPTLLSRFEVKEISPKKNLDDSIAKKFIKLPLKEKLDFAHEIASDIKDEKKSKSDAINFVSELEIEMQKALVDKKNTSEIIFFVEELLLAKKSLYGRSPSIKLILEHLSLTCPKL